MKKINSYGGISIQTNPTILQKYIIQKLQFYVYRSSKTLNEILFELIKNLNKTDLSTNPRKTLGRNQFFLQSRFQNSSSHHDNESSPG